MNGRFAKLLDHRMIMAALAFLLVTGVGLFVLIQDSVTTVKGVRFPARFWGDILPMCWPCIIMVEGYLCHRRFSRREEPWRESRGKAGSFFCRLMATRRNLCRFVLHIHFICEREKRIPLLFCL